MGMGLRGSWGAGIRKVHPMMAGKVRLWKFSEILLIQIEGNRSADPLNCILCALALQSRSNLLAYVIEFPAPARFKPVNGISGVVCENARYFFRLEIANLAMRFRKRPARHGAQPDVR